MKKNKRKTEKRMLGKIIANPNDKNQKDDIIKFFQLFLYISILLNASLIITCLALVWSIIRG